MDPTPKKNLANDCWIPPQRNLWAGDKNANNIILQIHFMVESFDLFPSQQQQQQQLLEFYDPTASPQEKKDNFVAGFLASSGAQQPRPPWEPQELQK